MRVKIKGGPIEVELESDTGTLEALRKAARLEFDEVLTQFSEIGMALFAPEGVEKPESAMFG